MRKGIWLHTTCGMDARAFASFKTEKEVREYFGKHVPEMPVQLPPERIKTLYVQKKTEDGSEIWLWGGEEAHAEMDECPGKGWLVSVNGKDLHDSLVEDD